MQIIDKKLTDLKPYTNNPRHNAKAVPAVKESILKFGFKVPLVIDKNNVIVCGHTRFYASKEIGLETVPCIVADDLTDEQINAFRLVDNRVSEFADWNFDKLAEELSDLQDFDFEPFGFDELMAGLEVQYDTKENDVKEDDYDAELPAEPKTKYGDIYQLGNNRLMCGNSTKEEDVEKLMNGEKADISFTSPPYNAGATPTEIKMVLKSKYQNDNDNKTIEEYTKFLTDFTNISLKHSDFSFVNIQSLSNNKISLIEYLYNLKNNYADTIIWDKMLSQPAMAENVLDSEFEYVHIFNKTGSRVVGQKKFRGMQKNIIHIKKQTKNELSHIHNATFSIEFASHFIKNFSVDSVLDLFGGTGTTLIACEQLDRKCYMMELDPIYCDVIIDRWQKFTGKKAEKING